MAITRSSAGNSSQATSPQTVNIGADSPQTATKSGKRSADSAGLTSDGSIGGSQPESSRLTRQDRVQAPVDGKQPQVDSHKNNKMKTVHRGDIGLDKASPERKAYEKTEITNYSKLDGDSNVYRNRFNFLGLLTIIAGTKEFMTEVANKYDKPLEFAQVPRKASVPAKAKEIQNGIIFVGSEAGGHFHFVKDGVASESYTKNWQMKDSHGFCQTYALMGYLGKTENFIEGNFTHNAQQVISFLRDQSPFIAAQFKATCDKNIEPIPFDEPKLNAREIEEDLSELLHKSNKKFIGTWLTSETTFCTDDYKKGIKKLGIM